eukprot:2072685-Alexandrium_andersonii.AAC.1
MSGDEGPHLPPSPVHEDPCESELQMPDSCPRELYGYPAYTGYGYYGTSSHKRDREAYEAQQATQEQDVELELCMKVPKPPKLHRSKCFN